MTHYITPEKLTFEQIEKILTKNEEDKNRF